MPSRVSSNSSLSPSATRGSNRFDLGKDSGVDMGRKARPSVTSGGIGVTQEVANIGGMTVTGGVSVDVSPINLDISGQPNFEDPSKSQVSIAGGAEIPGGILGISGGVTINTSTGEVTEVAIGGEVAGVGVNISQSKEGGVGVSVSLQIPFTPIEISLGFGFPPDEEPKTPTPPPPPPPPPPSVPMPSPSAPNLSCTKYFVSWTRKYKLRRDYYNNTDPIKGNTKLYPYELTTIYEDRIREVYPYTANYSDAQIHQEFGTPVVNPSALFNQQFRPVRYYYYEVGNGISFSGVAWHEVFVAAGASPPNRVTDMTIMRSWHNIISGGRVVLEKVDLKEVYYAREILGYNSTGQIIWSDWQYTGEFEYILKCADAILLPPAIIAPFPNPPPRKEPMDACCREVLKFQRQMYTKLGLARFPGELPSTIIQEVPNEGEEPAEPPQVPIPDLVSFMDWIFKRDDERWGQWEIQINVKDADVTKEDDQGKKLRFPNLAESIAEIEGQMLSLSTNIDALVAITTKNLVESGLTRQEAIKGYLASKAMIKYMAFKTEEIDVTVPLCFTPGAETIHGLITESELHLKGMDYIEKETLRDVFLDLLQAAAIIRAVHWQRIDTKTDTKSQLLGILKGSLDLANSVKNPTRPTDGSEPEKPKEDFEDFLDNAEDGFRNKTGITDMQNPYGKTPDRRPRIRQIGDNIAQAGGDN